MEQENGQPVETEVNVQEEQKEIVQENNEEEDDEEERFAKQGILNSMLISTCLVKTI